jgi:Family of unknown function (DUF6174)
LRLATIVGIAASIGFIAVGCGRFDVAPVKPIASSATSKLPLMAEFDRNLDLWQSTGIGAYAFTYESSCFCPSGPHLIVSDGTSVRIDGVRVDRTAPPPAGAPVGVDGLFEIVRRAIEGDRATITYDPATGVPTAMDSDPIVNAMDDELAFKVTGWTLDPPDDSPLGDVTSARRLWEEQSLWTYSWTIAIACDCVHDGRSFDMIVRDGEPAVRSGGKAIATDQLEGVPLTVPALFDFATTGATSPGFRFEFDAARGYPTRVDVHDDRPDAVQFETITVRSFTAP